jgi:Protein of unknown function (DUF2612)
MAGDDFSGDFGGDFGSNPIVWLALIPPENNQKTNFMAMLTAVLQPFADSIVVANSLPGLFNLESAVGSQLDTIGLWIGITRNIPVPGTNTFIALTDPQYLALLKAKIAMNQWNGTIPGAQAALALLFPGTTVLIQDSENNHMSFALMPSSTGQVALDDLFSAAVLHALVPAGITVDGFFTPGTGGGPPPYFGLDAENGSISGLDVGFLV